MSRNSSRTKINRPTPQPSQPNIAPPQQQQSNPFGISFVVPTEVIELPTRGRFYEQDSTLYGRQNVEIRHMTAREEDLLANQSFIEDGSVFDRLLGSILVDKSIDVQELIETDRNAILIAARITGYGSEYSMKMPCSHCRKVCEFVFNLEEREIVENELDGVSFESDSGLFCFQLPKLTLEAKVKVLTGRDLEYLDKQKQRAEELGLEHNATINLFRLAVVEVQGISDQSHLNQLFEALPAIDSRKIRSVVNSITPRVSTKQKVACGSCGEESESEVPFTLGFFWPDL
tara:strand:- start:80 stop:943 length:864 start_codon:yes stop_codon:yes gene_type:complete